MKRFLASLLVVGTLLVATVDAYQVCSTAMQVTFKNGTNLVLDMETGIDLY